jgi:hypothetical protein
VAYWLLPFVLAAVQLWVTESSLNQIRYEELAEGVRSVYWLDQRLVYDGVYTNVGWYGFLLIAYKIFGFSLFSAKFVRLGLHLAGLVSIAALLRRAMPHAAAMVPLVLVGLSPTMLFFDSMQTSFGMDVSYAAICLWLMSSITIVAPGWTDIAKAFACGVVAMVAAMSYPAFFFYVPSLLIVWAWLVTRAGASVFGAESTRLGLAAAGGFVLPLVAAFLYIQTRSLLIFDPDTQAGLFRAGGHLGFDSMALGHAIGTVLHDLLIRGGSYYYEVARPDWSGPLAAAGLCGLIATVTYLTWSRKIDRALVAAAALLLVTSLVIPSLSIEGEPGLRRSTGILAAYFALFSLSWAYVATARARTVWLAAGMMLCLLLPLDSAIKVPSLVADEEHASIFRNHDWFSIEPTPVASLDEMLARLDHSKGLGCPTDQDGQVTPCRYQEIYAALAGYREWNGLPVVDIHAVDWRTGKDIVLTPALWRDKYYPTCTRLVNCH